jgi:energy-coupling factor transporter ATP-binding protein EcfA2
MISLESVCVSLPSGSPQAKSILENISISLQAGEITVIVGGNGSGKTTLLQTLAGLIQPDSGRVAIAESPRDGSEPVLALLLQEPDNQFVASSVLSELRLGWNRWVGEEATNGSRFKEAIARFELKPLLERNPHRLSGGEKQRLALASIWLARPDILLLDEPTTYLDSASRQRCYEIVAELNSDGTTVVWATPGGQDLTQADRVIWIEQGRIRFDGRWPDLFRCVDLETAVVVPPPVVSLAINLVGDRGISDLEILADRLVQLAGEKSGSESNFSTSRELSHDSGPAGSFAADPPPLIRLDRVSFAYTDEDVIRGINLEVPAGRCLGITGPNGSGKTTLLHLAAGTLNPTRGGIYRRYETIAEAGRQNVFFLFQSPERMFFAETVQEELAFGLQQLGVGRQDRAIAIEQGLVEAGLEPDGLMDRSPMTLSFGEMRRLALALFLTLKPRVLLLDEPTACLDVPGRDRLRLILNKFLADGGTVMVTSHDLDFVLEVADRLIHLEAGQVSSSLNLAGGMLPEGGEWPIDAVPLILQLQDLLARRGYDSTPRRVTAAALRGYLAGSSQTRKPT